MGFELALQRASLLTALKRCEKVKERGTIPILDTVKISHRPAQGVRVAVTNLDQTLSHNVAGAMPDVGGRYASAGLGEACVDLCKLLKLAKTWGDDVVRVKVLATEARFVCGARTAQDAVSYDRATDLEGAGQQVIDLPANDWKAISEAA